MLGTVMSLRATVRDDYRQRPAKNLKALDKFGNSWHHNRSQFVGLLYLDRIQEL